MCLNALSDRELTASHWDRSDLFVVLTHCGLPPQKIFLHKCLSGIRRQFLCLSKEKERTFPWLQIPTVTGPTLRMENFGLLTVIIPFPSGKVPRFPQGQLSHYPHDLHLDHLHRHQGWGAVWEGMLAMKGAHKGKDGAIPSRNRGMGERPPGDPNLPLPSNVFPLIQPTTASSRRHQAMPTSGRWTCPPWATRSSIPARKASPSRVAPSTVPAKQMAAGQANHPSAWVGVPLGEPLQGGRPKGTAELE